MYDLKLTDINNVLVKAIKLTVACRRMVGKGSEVYPDLMDIEREIREAAAECQRVLALGEGDNHRPLLER